MKLSAISTWGGFGVVAALLAAGLWWAPAKTPAPGHQPAPTTASAAPATPATTVTAGAPKPAAAAPVLTKAQRVDLLSKSPSPVDAFTAYNIIAPCVYARRAEAEGEKPMRFKSSHEACEDLTPGQIVGRLQLLERAATAGVHGAAMESANEGPTGYGWVGNADRAGPEYEAWARRQMEFWAVGVKTGDAASLMTLSMQVVNSDPVKALTYWVAKTELSKQPPENSNVFNQLSQSLTPEQRAAAMEEGKRIARAARPVEGDRQ
jgi:hypothetical protein